MIIQQLTLGAYQTNCYFLWKEKQLVIIDPGASANKIISFLQEHDDFKLMAILLTHGHLDHVGAVDKLVNQYHCDVYASQLEKDIITNPQYCKFSEYQITLNSPIKAIETNKLKIGDFNFEVFDSPGHTRGSVMFLIENNLFSGDTLFYHSVGRTDLYGGNNNQLRQSLQIITQLDPNVVVYPGHEEKTTIQEELQFNPYL